MSRIERPKRYEKSFLLSLTPTNNPNFVPFAGSTNSGTYQNLDLRNLFDQQEADRPWLISFSMISAASAATHTVVQTSALQVTICFNNGQNIESIRGGFSPLSLISIGNLFFQELANNVAAIQTRCGDNEPVYINNLRNVSSITVFICDQNYTGVDLGALPVILNLHFSPADISKIV